VCLPPITHAEHFSIRRYGISDGLPHNRVPAIYRWGFGSEIETVREANG